MEDVVIFGLDVNMFTGRTEPSNVILIGRGTTLVCETIVDQACINQHTQYGCLLLALDDADVSTSGGEQATKQLMPSGDSSHGGNLSLMPPGSQMLSSPSEAATSSGSRAVPDSSVQDYGRVSVVGMGVGVATGEW